MRSLYVGCVSLFVCLLSACSSGSSNGSSSSSSTTDMGTIAGIDSTYTITIQNAVSGMVLGVSGQSQSSLANVVQESSSTTTTNDKYWHVLPMNSYEYNVENMLTHQLMSVSGASTTDGAQVVQSPDTGKGGMLWRFYLLTDGNYLIQNVNSGLYLEDVDSRPDTSAMIAQGSRTSGTTGCECQEWKISSTKTAAYPSPEKVTATYSSAYSDTESIGIHDPSMLKVGSNYYLYTTHGALHAHSSSDRKNFVDEGYAMNSVPSWASIYNGSDDDLWAPDVSYHSTSSTPYWIYYASSTFGSYTSGIGIAYSETGAPNSFADSGSAIYYSSRCSGANAIDPSSTVDTSGNAWMVFGSFDQGIFMVPVDSSTGIPSSTAKCTRVAYHSSGTGLEGAYIYQHGGYYYLFASVDACCSGTSSTYRIVVGRSSTINGTYYDRGGTAMTSGGGTILLSTHGTVIGPGGQGVLSDLDGDILVYHYYDGTNNGYPVLGLNVLGWDSDGWPYISQ